MAYDMQGDCWHCGRPLTHPDFAREATCPGCGKPTHVCRNCRFYSISAPGQCREPVADPVSDKLRPNFCGYFEATRHAQHDGAATDADALRQAAENLFKF